MNSKSKILIVDDEEGPRESLKIILKPEFEVVTLGRGSEAVELLRDGAFELVLLDITMPEDLSGIETLQAIRTAGIDVEAIVISGQGAADPIVECVNLGAHRYIKKPYRADEVMSAVRSAIAGRTARRRAETMREHFLGSLSHELRTPLNAIVGYSEILHEEAGNVLGDEHRHALSRIQQSSERLLAYWEGLFFLGELDSGSVPAKLQDVPVLPWLERFIQRLDRRGNGGPGLTLDCPEHLVVHSHAETLGQLFAVLIYEATENEGGTIKLTVRQGHGVVNFLLEHDRLAFDVPDGDEEPDAEAAATELARQLVARASDLLGAMVTRHPVDEQRVQILITVPDGRATMPGTGAKFPSRLSPGAIAADAR